MEVMQTMKQQAKAEVTPIPTIYEEELIKLVLQKGTTTPDRLLSSYQHTT
jgi:hypothetical protein